MKLPLWRRRREEELEEEIQCHLQMAIRDRMERGESAEEAESAVRREFGNLGLIKETTRGMWGWAQAMVTSSTGWSPAAARPTNWQPPENERTLIHLLAALAIQANHEGG